LLCWESIVRLGGKVSIVTGAGSGIGRATAIRFAEEGSKVVVDDLNSPGGNETVARITRQGGKAFFVKADASNSEEVQSLINTAEQQYGPVDVLVNSAIPSNTAMADNRWDAPVNVGLKGCWLCMQAAIKSMRKARSGSIINISSVNALMGFGNDHVYSGVKAGIIGMSRSLVGEVGKMGIRINCICPGTIVTEIWQPDIDRDPTLLERLSNLYPIGRLGKPEDVANLALFLASDESSCITGSVLIIDGGVTASNLGFSI
jgi:3-oxoacyl-[acyl-carrier protein] reductase